MRAGRSVRKLRGRSPSCAMPIADSQPPTATAGFADNPSIAQALREMAALLDAQGDNAYRVAAYRRAADMVAHLPRSLRDIHRDEGEAGLDALPGVGPRIAAAIAELVSTGRWQQLERLRGEADPDALLRTIPGVGAELAHRLHDELGVQTLEALELAAHDGRLERLPRIGARRAAAIRSALQQMLDRQRSLRRSRPAPSDAPEPPVALLLEVDRSYRAGAQAGTLPTIAPKRFNPDGKAWLPVLHTDRPGWHITALYSNTARAHELGRVHDWVVLYVEDDAHREHQYTVVTAGRGTLVGQRVVRGREAECQSLCAAQAAAPR
jgi:Holliday junction resolvasome RuvABC DNA-binding subunit